MNYILGIDIGTSGTKAVAFSHDGEILGNAYRSYEPLETVPGHHELDPVFLFEAFIQTVSEILISLEGKAALTAICFSSAMHSLLLVDKENQPITNLVTWADLRSRNQAARLRASPEGADIYRLSGTPIHPMTPLCKIMWFRETEPALFKKATRFISIKEYIVHRLTGKYLVDYSIASGTGLFDIYHLRWNPVALSLAGITIDQLSPPVTTTHIEQVDYRLNKDLLLQTQLVLGATDGCLANLGSNAVKHGDVAVTIGTSGAVRMVNAAPKYDAKGRIFNYILTPELFVSGGPINNGGVLLKWYTENFLQYNLDISQNEAGVSEAKVQSFQNKGDASGGFEAFIETASTVAPGCEGLVFLPYIQGERAPVWDAEAKGVFFGIKSVHTQAHFIRAIIEGICFSLRDVSLSIEETIGTINNIYASGGFVKSPAWVQILCDILGKKVHITDTADASSIGAAMLGLYATNVIQKVEDASRFLTIQKTYSPATNSSAAYDRNFGIYQNLYIKLKEEFRM
ncbi:gluconokinase [Flavitalea sp.]|nr:gluconokinase [Flavitalea sp.]